MSEQIVHLDPSHVLADPRENIRFGSKAMSRQALMDSILEQGGVMEPVEVQVLKPPVDGKTHRLIFGFGRHAAVAELNATQEAGLTLPCIVRDVADADRTKRQIAENVNRESLSPMDKAVAIQRLIDEGVEKPEIRRIFTSVGGKKGNEARALSNAMLNIYLRFLDLPKTMQEKIHDGRVGVAAAYMLGKVPPEKRAAVLERAEKDRQEQLDLEEKDEAKYLEAEAKVAETADKAKAAESEVETAKEDVAKAEALVTDKTQAYGKIKNEILAMDRPATAADAERLKAAEADKKGSEKTLKDAKTRLNKAQGTATSAAELAAEKKAQLEAARKAVKSTKGKSGKSKGEGISREDVKKAAKGENTTTGVVALGIGDIRQTMKDIVSGKLGADDRVAAVAKCFKDCFDGKDTEKELVINLNTLLDAMHAVLPKKAMPVEEAEAPGKHPGQTPPAAPDVKQGPKGKK